VLTSCRMSGPLLPVLLLPACVELLSTYCAFTITVSCNQEAVLKYDSWQPSILCRKCWYWIRASGSPLWKHSDTLLSTDLLNHTGEMIPGYLHP